MVCPSASSPTYLVQHDIVGATERATPLLQHVANRINLHIDGDGNNRRRGLVPVPGAWPRSAGRVRDNDNEVRSSERRHEIVTETRGTHEARAKGIQNEKNEGERGHTLIC